MDFKEIIEPLRLLFKDEVRQLGRELESAGISGDAASPSPARAWPSASSARSTKEKAGHACGTPTPSYREEIAKAGLDDMPINQYFAVLTNTRSVGVMGDGRTYDYTLALRAVTTSDFMTADWARIPYERAGQDLCPHRQ